MKRLTDLMLLRQDLRAIVTSIKLDIIDHHNMPFRVFETGRTLERQKKLYDAGHTKTLRSRHLFERPDNFSTAVDIVYCDKNGGWSWRIEDPIIRKWWSLLGEMILRAHPELEWGYRLWNWDWAHFQLKEELL